MASTGRVQLPGSSLAPAEHGGCFWRPGGPCLHPRGRALPAPGLPDLGTSLAGAPGWQKAAALQGNASGRALPWLCQALSQQRGWERTDPALPCPPGAFTSNPVPQLSLGARCGLPSTSPGASTGAATSPPASPRTRPALRLPPAPNSGTGSWRGALPGELEPPGAASPAALGPHVWHGTARHGSAARAAHRGESPPQGTASGLITAVAGLRNTEAAARWILITRGIVKRAFLFHLRGKDKPVPLKTVQAERGKHIDKLVFQLGMKVTCPSAAHRADAEDSASSPCPQPPTATKPHAPPGHQLCGPPGEPQSPQTASSPVWQP